MLKYLRKFNVPILWVATVFCTILSAQEQRYVAIPAPIGKSASITQFNKDIVRSKIQEFIVNASDYKVIDRTSTDQILGEHAFQRSGVVDNSKVAELGKILGAHLVCVTYLSKEEGAFHAEASVIDVETGEIFNSASEFAEEDTPRAINIAIEELVARLLKLKRPMYDTAKETAKREEERAIRDEERQAAMKKSTGVRDLLARRAADLEQAEMEKKIREEKERVNKEIAAKMQFPKFTPTPTSNPVPDFAPVEGKAIIYIVPYRIKNMNIATIQINQGTPITLNKGTSNLLRFELFEGIYKITAATKFKGFYTVTAKAGSVHYILLEERKSTAELSAISEPKLFIQGNMQSQNFYQE